MSGDPNPKDTDTDPVHHNDDQKPTAKKIKLEEEGDVEAMALVGTHGWHDIPNWGDREDSPLMELPSTLLDKIFCVRPELGVSLHFRQEGRMYANNQVPRLCSFGWSLQILPTSHDQRLLEGVFTSYSLVLIAEWSRACGMSSVPMSDLFR